MNPFGPGLPLVGAERPRHADREAKVKIKTFPMKVKPKTPGGVRRLPLVGSEEFVNPSERSPSGGSFRSRLQAHLA